MKSKKSFTLIELLVVIAIIGILVSLVVLNITTGKQKAIDSKRVQEANGLVKALNIYYNQNDSWPTEMTATLKEVCNTNLLSPTCTDMVDLSSMDSILTTIPVDPDAEGFHTGYWVAYNHRANEPMAVPGKYQADCPEGYIYVPGNSYYHTLPGFCVMKWEAKCNYSQGSCGNPGSKIPVSKAENRPWREINQTSAKNRCQAAGGHLITNNEWMTIARNAESIDGNWTNNKVGDGVLFRGNSNTYMAMDGFDSLSEENTRTHTLTNGEVVWDMAGNAYNWTDNTISLNKQPTANVNGSGWSDFTSGGLFRYLISSAYLGSSLSHEDVQSSNPDWYSDDGVGRIYHYSNDSSTATRAFLRGGNGWAGARSGLFALCLSRPSTHEDPGIGFRCVR